MEPKIETELSAHLIAVQAIERQSLRLLSIAETLADDKQVAGIYRAHRLQTEAHARLLAERIAARGGGGTQAGATSASALETIEIRFAPGANGATLAVAAYVFENLEIAAYHLLRGIAERAGDDETAALAEASLDQEEAAAEVLASAFDRALAVSLGERPNSPMASFGSPRDDPQRA
jgi:ferritin-like metal-binding protein YciE